jgi:TetR/AcrR family transcriptional regulator, regulator of mycofactocin system
MSIGRPAWAETPEKTGLREHRKQQTRRVLEQVAFDLFTRRGFDGVTIDEIVAAANVSKRTFYRYYDTKEDVLLAEQLRLLDLISAGLLEGPPDEPLLDALCRALLYAHQRYGRDMGLMVQTTRLLWATPSLATRMVQHQMAWETSIAESIATRLGVQDDPDDLRPSMLAAALLAALRVITQRWLQDDGGDSLRELLARNLRLTRPLFPEL